MSETMYEVTNKSSRAFLFGNAQLLPHVPSIVNEEVKDTIINSNYGSFFEVKVSQPEQPEEELQS